VKPPLVGLAAFVVGLAGGTAVGVLRAPSPPSDGEVAVAPDSAAHSTTSGATAPEGRDTLARATPPDAAPPSPGDPPSPPRDSAEAVPSPAPERPADPSPADVGRAYEQLARILAGMKPGDAGKILVHVSDVQLEGLVRQMSPRQAAKLLSLIPPERAGLLSRRLLEHPAPAGP